MGRKGKLRRQSEQPCIELLTFASIVIDWNTTCCDVAFVFSVRDIVKLYPAREAISDLELRHDCFLWWVGDVKLCFS